MFDIKINNISVNYSGKEKVLLENCFLKISPGKSYILLGENGTGKTTFALAITGLLNKRIFNVSGSVLFNGLDLLKCDLSALNEIRRKDIKYVFQDPVNSFDPLKKIEYYFDLINPLIEERDKILDFFHLPPYEKISKLFPHEISVGMAQRLAFALAFIARPKLIIMDEPNSALDLGLSNLLVQKIKEYVKTGSSLLIITQDTFFAKNIGDEVSVLSSKTIAPLIRAEEYFSNLRVY